MISEQVTKEDLVAACEEINRKRSIQISMFQEKSETALVKALMKATSNGYRIEGLSKKTAKLLTILGGEKLKDMKKKAKEARNERIKKLLATILATHTKVNMTLKNNKRAAWTFKPTSKLTDEEWTYLRRVRGRQRYTMRDYLERAAIDMNEVMGLSPPINIDASYPIFIKQFKEAAKMAHGTDNFTNHTWTVLKYMKLGPERLLAEPIFINKEC